MEISLYQIDAFASELFDGNPAAVCPLDEWLADELMQSIASENNLSEKLICCSKTCNTNISILLNPQKA
jgi:PhzF family phenazine biosynthesis protein